MSGQNAVQKCETDEVLEFLDGLPERKINLLAVQLLTDSTQWMPKPHSHNHYELIYFLNGQAKVSAVNRPMYAELYNLLIYPPGVVHQEFPLYQSGSLFCLFFSVSQSDDPGIPIQLSDHMGKMRWLLERLHEEYKNPERNTDVLVDSFLRVLFIYIHRYYRQLNENSGSAIFNACMQYINNYFHQPITIDTLVDLTHVSPSYLFRLFSRKLGMSPIHYLNHLRISEAERMLTSTSLSVKQVAYQVGFNDPQTFSRLFKRQYHYPPSQAKDNHLSSGR